MLRATIAVLALAAEAAVPGPVAHSSVTPRTGDWEGTANGLHASFELVHNRANAVYGAEPYGMYDLVISTPGTCPTDPGQPTILEQGTRRYQILIGPNGAFPWHQGGKPYGWITRAGTARVRTGYDIQEGNKTCRGSLRFKLHPASRRPVDDGAWKLTFSDGEHQHLDMAAGGRYTSLSLPNVAPVCSSGSGGHFGGIDVFIPADGQVDQTVHEHPGTITLYWTFTSAHAGHGSFVAAAPGCKPGKLTFQSRHRS
jgi:hypothetical protein